MKTILLVDDNFTHLQLIAHRFEESGIQTHTAESLAQAFNKTDQLKFDFILTDLHLPDGRGDFLLNMLPNFYKQRVFMYTGDLSCDVKILKSKGVREVFFKPIDANAIRQIIGIINSEGFQ